MKKQDHDTTTRAFEAALTRSKDLQHYVLSLFVTGMTPRSTEALAAIKAICEEHLQGRYTLEVIDIYQHPEQAAKEQLIAAPTLIKKLPLPLRRLVGRLSDTECVLAGLNLRAAN